VGSVLLLTSKPAGQAKGPEAALSLTAPGAAGGLSLRGTF
jgi:hypothetical protein